MLGHALIPAGHRTRRTGLHSRVLISAVLAGILLATAQSAVTAAPTSPAASAEAGTIVLRPPTRSMPASWQRAFVIPYGTSRSKLGLGTEGDGKGTPVGPNYGAQAPDGTWWFVDTHKFRFAHYSRRGRFIEAVRVPKRYLAGGVYFPHQMPRVLNDGTLVAGNVVDNATDLLRVKDGAVTRVTMNREAIFRADDGRRLYGFDWNGPAVMGNPNTGAVTDVRYFRSRGGDRYRVTTRDPHHPIWAALVREGLLAASPEPLEEPADGGWVTLQLSISGGHDEAAQVLSRLAAGGVPISSYLPVEPSLVELIEKIIHRAGGGAPHA
jgi:hypothetical protein